MIDQLTWLAINLYHEARGEPEEGQLAVCHVVLNRVAKRGLSIKDVVLQPMQFSWANSGARPPIKDYGALENCLLIAQQAINERLLGEVFYKADHYYNPNKADPRWARSMRPVKTIGNHIFLREE